MSDRTAERVPLAPVNRSPLAPHYPWPPGKTAAMFLSFDVDAESGMTARDPANYERLITMSFGGYEARVGVGKILELLRDMELKATFFITGWAVEAHPAMAESILRDSHEIAHHGFHHMVPDPGDPMIMEELQRGLETLKRRLGVVPVGYRAPGGESCEQLRALLQENGFQYSSSWRDDVRPYRQILADGRPGVIELPITMTFDDWNYGMTQRLISRPLFPREHVLSIWNDELEEMRSWGGMITTVLHPQVSGRPMWVKLVREFLAGAQNYGDVWIATGQEISSHFTACERKTLP
jgi:peptidoglycan-N-acetylglucosamine deacetylase